MLATQPEVHRGGTETQRSELLPMFGHSQSENAHAKPRRPDSDGNSASDPDAGGVPDGSRQSDDRRFASLTRPIGERSKP